MNQKQKVWTALMKSKTVHGAVLTALSIFAPKWSAYVASHLEAFITLVGLIYVIYGRYDVETMKATGVLPEEVLVTLTTSPDKAE